MLHKSLRWLVWIYLFFLIFEGVLRKWVFPGQSNIFLVVRDPLVLLIYLLAMADRRFPWHAGTLGAGALGLVAMVFSIFSPNAAVIVLLYGFKAAFLHVPLIFVLPHILERRDLDRIGWAVLALAPVMAVLMAIQFQAAPESWWNVGAGGSEDGQMEGAMGRIRPPGLFSFITGAAQYCALLMAFLLDSALRVEGRRRWWWLGLVAFSLVICVTVSISRMLWVMVVAPLFMLGFLLRARPELVGRLVGLISVGLVALLLASGLEVFDEGTEAFNSRLGRTGDYHASWLDRATNVAARLLEDPYWAWLAAKDAPLLGHGLGAGTNVAAASTSGRLYFALGEGEWVRMVLELGPLLGLPYLLFRVGLGLSLLGPAWRAAREGSGLAIFLFANAFPLLVVGQWGQATTLGFAMVMAGLCLTAAKLDLAEAEAAPVVPDTPDAEAPARLRSSRWRAEAAPEVRGVRPPRSVPAEPTDQPPRVRRRAPAEEVAPVEPPPEPAPGPAAQVEEPSEPAPPPRFHVRVRPRPPAEDDR